MLLYFGLIGLLSVVGAQATEPAVTIRLQEPWANVFAGKETVFHATLATIEPFDGRIAWRFSADGRTLSRGESAVKAGPTATGTVEVRINVPAVKPGVIMQTTLSVSASQAGSDKEVAIVDRTLWVFPEDPFTGCTEWLKKLNIRLFDPVGTTAKLFTDASIPFAEIRSVDALTSIEAGTLIVGEGVSLKEYRGLAENLIKTAAVGRPVLCLALDNWEMQLPASGDPALPQPTSLVFHQQDIIKELDKRLDVEGWKGKGKVTSSSLKLRGDRGPVMAEVSRDAGMWPWMELGFEKENGKLIVCGFGIVGAWAESPTPRFLLLKVLEHVSGSKGKE